MHRVAAIVAMVGAVVAAHLVNEWFAQSLRAAQAEFRTGDLVWLFGLLPLLAAVAAVGLGWLVLRASRPDPVVGAIYAVAGLAVVFVTPLWMSGGWAAPDWLPMNLLDDPALAVWMAAGVTAIGIAELVRWARSRPLSPDPGAGSARPQASAPSR